MPRNGIAGLSVTIAVMKYREQKQVGGGGIWLVRLHHCSSSKEVRTGTQTRQDPEGRS